MDVFLDTCIIFGRHIPRDPQHEKVMTFYKNNRNHISTQTTCNKVKSEVYNKLKKIIENLYGDQSQKQFRKIRMAVMEFLEMVNIVDYSCSTDSDICFLYAELEDHLKNPVMENWDDREVFINAILWCLFDKPNNPYFVTTDKNDYSNKFNIMVSTNSCLNENGYPSTPIHIVVL